MPRNALQSRPGANLRKLLLQQLVLRRRARKAERPGGALGRQHAREGVIRRSGFLNLLPQLRGRCGVVLAHRARRARLAALQLPLQLLHLRVQRCQLSISAPRVPVSDSKPRFELRLRGALASLARATRGRAAP